MIITIKSKRGEQEYEMAEPMFETLTYLARMFASACTQGERDTAAAPEETAPAPEKEEQPEQPRSRVERMFGPRSEWGTQTGDPGPEEDGGETYKGFLLIECEKCKELRGFCAKTPIRAARCNCGHETELHDLLPAFVTCDKCGKTFKYRTNVAAQRLSYTCLSCGAPVDLELNGKGTAYVTISTQERRGGGTEKPFSFRPFYTTPFSR